MADVGKLKLSLNACGIGSMELDGFDLSNYASCIEYKAEAGEIAKVIITLALVDVEAQVEILPEALKVAIKEIKSGDKYCAVEGKIKKIA